jgi:transitional endoplasmic reticulum ATPase
MAVTYSTFDRLKSKGIAAYKNGDYTAARSYLQEAAECLLEMAEQAESESVRDQRVETARELIDLAKDCDRQKAAPSRSRSKAADGDDKSSDASDWLVADRPSIGFDDIAGLEEVKDEIRLKMIYPFTYPELASRYGIRTGGGVLLYGPPGTGKTMMAKAIAHELEAAFFVVSPAQLLSKWVGEAEQNIRKLFEAAKGEPKSIIFMDEVEALVPKRKSGSSTVMQRVVPQILQELEGFDRKADRALLFIGATNKPWMLDEAMMRPGRLDARIYVPLPDEPARFRLLEIYLNGEKLPLADDVDYGKLTDLLKGYSGADIKNIAELAARRPFMEAIAARNPEQARPVTMRDVLDVIADSPPSVKINDLTRYERFAETGV